MRLQNFYALVALVVLSGCGWVPQGKFSALESQSRILSEQNKAQLAEIENLKNHSRTIEDQLIRAEQQLAGLDQKAGANAAQLAASHQQGLAPNRPFAAKADEVDDRLPALSRRYRHLQYDPQTGMSKLDTDVLFPSGDTQIKGEAERVLREFARVMQQPDVKDLKIMVVGHTDDAGIKGREVRSKHGNNWLLSSARAVAVAAKLRDAGITDDRIGVSGFAETQPIAPNDTAENRGRNRRVEIFVVGPQTPIVGWTETISSVYQQ